MSKFQIQDFKSSMKFSNDIAEICLPLKELNIDFFKLIRIYNNDSFVFLTNNRLWLEHFYDKQLYEKGNFSSRHHAFTQKSIFLWSAMPEDEVRSIAREYYDISSGITLFEKFENYKDFYLFAVNSKNAHAINYCINNIYVLEHFIAYFKDKFRVELHAFNPVTTIVNALALKNKSILKKPQINLKNFYDKTESNHYCINFNNREIRLSKREYECYIYIAKGLSIKDIALKLNIKPRTCEFYIQNLKQKLNCTYNSEIILQDISLLTPCEL